MESRSQKKIFNQQVSLIGMLISLTVIFVAGQVALFITHYHVGDLLDSLVKSSLTSALFSPVIFLPITEFIFIQIISYILFVIWIWFLATSIGQLFKLSRLTAYYMGLLLWLTGCIAILTLNNYYYPHSFFSELIQDISFFTNPIATIFLICSIIILLCATILAYVNYFWHKKNRKIGSLLLMTGIAIGLFSAYDKIMRKPSTQSNSATVTMQQSKPNIIIIGLDSLRPDFVNYFGKRLIHTPHIDQFLQSATVFTEAYTPLARTFPTWISILTGKYPKNNHARSNLPNPIPIISNDTLAKHLQQAGYHTIYGTDEKRFSNITKQYGFDAIIGPRMGINDFILGGLSDFPLTNLLINTSFGKFLFPYNFSNRASAITYNPNQFLNIVERSLNKKSSKPLFLAVHFCISHWPYTWARDHQSKEILLSEQYQNSVEEADNQFGKFMLMLKKHGLLAHSLVILLSDHGTTLGLPNDRTIAEPHYQGKPDLLKSITRFQFSTQNPAEKLQFQINTSYGQATDVLSLKQYHALLAVKGFGMPTIKKNISTRVSLLDIAPSILALLHLSPLENMDGIPFTPEIFNNTNSYSSANRPFFLESGYSIADIEHNHINVNKVIHQSIAGYKINSRNGLLSLNREAEKGILKDKQFAVLMDNWLLAYYPISMREKLVPKFPGSPDLILKPSPFPSYYVLVNVKTGKWTIGLSTPFAKTAPVPMLLAQLHGMYGNEAFK